MMVWLLIFCKIDVNCQSQANGKQMLSRKKFQVHTACNTELPAAVPGLPHLHGAGHPQSQGRKEKGCMLPYLLLIWEFFRPGICTPQSKMFYFMYMRAFSGQTAGSHPETSHAGSDSDLELQVSRALHSLHQPPQLKGVQLGKQKALLALNTPVTLCATDIFVKNKN